MILRVHIKVSSVTLHQMYKKEQTFGNFYSFEGREKNFQRGKKNEKIT